MRFGAIGSEGNIVETSGDFGGFDGGFLVIFNNLISLYVI